MNSQEYRESLVEYGKQCFVRGAWVGAIFGVLLVLTFIAGVNLGG